MDTVYSRFQLLNKEILDTEVILNDTREEFELLLKTRDKVRLEIIDKENLLELIPWEINGLSYDNNQPKYIKIRPSVSPEDYSELRRLIYLSIKPDETLRSIELSPGTLMTLIQDETGVNLTITFDTLDNLYSFMNTYPGAAIDTNLNF